APLNADGTIGAWSATTSFPNPRAFHRCVAYNGYIYVTGGAAVAGTVYNDVQIAQINPDGTLGSWRSTSSFLTPREGHTTVAYNGYLYILGGYGGGNYLNDVQMAPINSNGAIGPWNKTSS